jgi:[protein-PII] uridylyltransferase
MSTHPSDPFYQRIRQHATRRIRFSPDTPKKERLKGYKQFLKMERELILRRHRKGAPGLQVCQEGAVLTDVIIESIFRTALLTYSEAHGTLPSKCSLVALGGYGRGELNPLSDIDLMFLFPDESKPALLTNMKRVLTDEVLYPLWDLGFKVGHCTRTVRECEDEAKLDFKTRNSLLESRLILGSAEIHRKMRKSYREWLDRSNLKPYIEEMLAMQEKRRTQHGGSVFMPEPNLKNGVGGLRDQQGVRWMVLLLNGKPSFDPFYAHQSLMVPEARNFEAAYDFMLRVRNELHLNSKRPTDDLTLGLQPIIAANLGYEGAPLERVEKLMKDYYQHAHNQIHIARAIEKRILSSLNQEPANTGVRRRFRWMPEKRKAKPECVEGCWIGNDLLYPENQELFDEDPLRILRLYRLMQERGLKCSSELERLIEAKAGLLDARLLTQPEASACIRQILTQPGKVFEAVESMHNLKVLERIIPEFRSLHCLIQHDLHLVRYSEDQKVIRSLQQLDRLVNQTDAKNTNPLPALSETDSLSDLYWAILLFPLRYPGIIRRQFPDPDRKRISITRILKRLGVDEVNMKRILTFIDSHRKMAHFWHSADHDDHRLIKQFSFNLHDHESAKKSLWFFYCDSLGRNPQYWQVHPIESATSVYQAILSDLNQNNPDKPQDQSLDVAAMTRMEINQRPIPGVSSDEVDAHFHLLPERYFATRNADDVKLHIALVHRLLESIQQADSLGSLKPIIDWMDDEKGNHSIINVVTWDRQGLFYKLAGAISSVGLNILRARAISRSDHIAIDTFYVQHGKTGQVESAEIKHRFEDAIESILVKGNKAYPKVREQYELSTRSILSAGAREFDLTLPVQADVYYDEALKQVVVDYQGKDRIGLLYRISRLFSTEGFNIDTVRIATSNSIASGSLFLSRDQMQSLSKGDALHQLREKLIAILGADAWLID